MCCIGLPGERKQPIGKLEYSSVYPVAWRHGKGCEKSPNKELL